jgi:hypothetical protein
MGRISLFLAALIIQFALVQPAWGQQDDRSREGQPMPGYLISGELTVFGLRSGALLTYDMYVMSQYPGGILCATARLCRCLDETCVIQIVFNVWDPEGGDCLIEDGLCAWDIPPPWPPNPLIQAECVDVACSDV